VNREFSQIARFAIRLWGIQLSTFSRNSVPYHFLILGTCIYSIVAFNGKYKIVIVTVFLNDTLILALLLYFHTISIISKWTSWIPTIFYKWNSYNKHVPFVLFNKIENIYWNNHSQIEVCLITCTDYNLYQILIKYCYTFFTFFKCF